VGDVAVDSAAAVGVEALARRGGRAARGLRVGVGVGDAAVAVAGSAVGDDVTVGASVSAPRAAATDWARGAVGGAGEGGCAEANGSTLTIGTGSVGVGGTTQVGAVAARAGVLRDAAIVAVGAAALTAASSRPGVSSSDAIAPAASTTSAQAAPISEI
jgi:hypothetical protein